MRHRRVRRRRRNPIPSYSPGQWVGIGVGGAAGAVWTWAQFSDLFYGGLVGPPTKDEWDKHETRRTASRIAGAVAGVAGIGLLASGLPGGAAPKIGAGGMILIGLWGLLAPPGGLKETPPKEFAPPKQLGP